MPRSPNEFLDAGEVCGAFRRMHYDRADDYVAKIQERALRGEIGKDEVEALADLWQRFVDGPRQAAVALVEAGRLIDEVQAEEEDRRRGGHGR